MAQYKQPGAGLGGLVVNGERGGKERKKNVWSCRCARLCASVDANNATQVCDRKWEESETPPRTAEREIDSEVEN